MNLEDFFSEHKKVALAFSGGVDSSYLLYVATKLGVDVKPYFAKTPFQPSFELEDAKKVGEFCHKEITVLEYDITEDEKVVENPINRCYFCKNALFSKLIEKAREDGYTTIIDGTNASDDADDRPGMVALKELKVFSPLRLCGLTKEDIRTKSREAGLFTYNKPSYACLATRIRSGEKITKELLKKVEEGEAFLYSLGLSDFRLRTFDNKALLQVREKDFSIVMDKREKIYSQLGSTFVDVLLDLKAR